MIYEAPEDILKHSRVVFADNEYYVMYTANYSTYGISSAITTLLFDAVKVKEPKIDWFMSFLKRSTSTPSLQHHTISGSVVAASNEFY